MKMVLSIYSKIFLKRFLTLFIPSSISICSVIGLLYYIQVKIEKETILNDQLYKVKLQSKTISRDFNSIVSDLMIISRLTEMSQIFNGSSASKSQLSQQYLLYSQQKRLYDKIRYVGISGKEVVRVSFNRGNPVIVPTKELQDQGKRYWFRDTFQLDKRQVFVSPLDLSFERGKVEQPLKPMIRFSTPVFDHNGHKQGVVILNYLGAILLENLNQLPTNVFSHGMLLNADGYWLKGIRPEDEWGFMFLHQKSRSFAATFPQAWRQISQTESGQFLTDAGMFTFSTVYPLAKGEKSSTGSGEAFSPSHKQLDYHSYYWKIVRWIPIKYLFKKTNQFLYQLLFFLVGSLGPISIISWLLAKSAVIRYKNDLELKQAEQVQKSLQYLQQNQAQLIHAEKMSSLGQLVAGIAHEINNPANFIHGNLVYLQQYISNLLGLIELYQKAQPSPTPEIQAYREEIDWQFIIEDLPKILASMKNGVDRIRDIVLSLRNFSRLDEADMKSVNIHEGIDSTLMILQHRLKDIYQNPKIEIVKEYGDIPPVECYAGQLNQVFMNILSNAIDAIDTFDALSNPKKDSLVKSHPSYIKIITELATPDDVRIKIVDNGSGLTEKVKQRVFEPFFTTKPAGKGSGLGLTISAQIIKEKHGGEIWCDSIPGKETEFCLKIPIRQNRKLV